ncbi:platelet-derived growth factor C [Gadus morhua]|uniref:platelet-derived growth factor C n=1 Tax=Gadus morhua TaxID=8049 RepID=UPI0011B62AD0|nr:platelet-derived growth factor C [Gadus morhua]
MNLLLFLLLALLLPHCGSAVDADLSSKFLQASVKEANVGKPPDVLILGNLLAFCWYDFVEIEDLSEGRVLGRWCGSQSGPAVLLSQGSQVRVRFVSDQYFPSEPGFCLHYSLLPPSDPEPQTPAVTPAPPPSVEELEEAVSTLGTVEEVLKYLDPEGWRADMEELYRPSWLGLGKSYIHNKKTRVGADLNQLREEVRLYSCSPRNVSVSLREELRRTDAIFWPGCLLVRRCGGNCSCSQCSQSCSQSGEQCACIPSRTSRKYYEVLQLKHRAGGRGLQRSMTDVVLEHHEECSCQCQQNHD